MNYQKGYYLLVSEVSKAITQLDNQRVINYEILKAARILQQALDSVDEMYLEVVLCNALNDGG